MKKVNLVINGKAVEAQEDKTILQAARDAGIDIPTLCSHSRLMPYGVCRLCMVEISKNGAPRVVASCMYNVEEGLNVETESPRVVKIRKMLLELMLASIPLNSAPAVEDLARRYGVEQSRFQPESSPCILCGLCVRYCAEVKKSHAIGFQGRGINRKVVLVPEVVSAGTCNSCRECYEVCPVKMWG